MDLSVIGITYFVSEKTTRDVNLFASHDNNLLAGKNLLGNNGGQPTKEMTLAIDNNGCGRESGHIASLRR